MTTTETSVRVCRRCHGSGREPAGPEYNAEQEKLLDRLSELGTERGELQRKRAYMRTDGRARYNAVLAEIRGLDEQAAGLNIRTLDVMDALGLSSPAYYKIVNGQTGG